MNRCIIPTITCCLMVLGVNITFAQPDYTLRCRGPLDYAVGTGAQTTVVFFAKSPTRANDASLSLLKPGYTMSSIIANEFAEAVSALHAEALIEIGLILFVITLILNVIARFLVWRVARRNPLQVRV